MKDSSTKHGLTPFLPANKNAIVSTYVWFAGFCQIKRSKLWQRRGTTPLADNMITALGTLVCENQRYRLEFHTITKRAPYGTTRSGGYFRISVPTNGQGGLFCGIYHKPGPCCIVKIDKHFSRGDSWVMLVQQIFVQSFIF